MRYAQLWSCCLLCTCAPHAQRSRLFSDEQLDNFADVVRRDGFVRMPGVFPKDKLRSIRAAFQPILQKRMEVAPSDRGPQRFYATPPFVLPFSDPAIFQQPVTTLCPTMHSFIHAVLHDYSSGCSWGCLPASGRRASYVPVGG
jgi:hypothetical protein